MEESIPAALRRKRMLRLVRDREFVRVTELSDEFGISTVTVRADLSALAESGNVQRVHGGAVALQDRAERPLEETLGENSAEKSAIGRHAARLIKPGDTVIIDVGSSTAAVAQAIVDRSDLVDVTVVTTSLPIALGLEPAIPRIQVVVSGGTLRPRQHSLVDPAAGVALDSIRAAMAFIGCNGVHATGGITNVNLPEADVKRRMMLAARQRIIVADGSKIGAVSVVKFAELADIDLIVTGESAQPAALAAIEDKGAAIEVAGLRPTNQNIGSDFPVPNGGTQK